jgi:protein SCO1/2
LLLTCGVPSQETYEVSGTVEAVDVAAGVVKIAHEEIPGFMPAMTMSFDVAAPELLEGVTPGASVRFTLERSATVLTITALRVTAPSDSGSGATLDPGFDLDLAPPFSLVNQDGAQVALADFEGKAVLLDFVFTRCTGPCPLLTAAHVRLQRRLPAAIRARTGFLSISVDPAHDTPPRLRAYARERGADLSDWSFLTGAPETVRDVVDAYYVGSTRRPDGQIDHVVATFLIDPEGRITERYLGLQHSPEDIIADLARVLS